MYLKSKRKKCQQSSHCSIPWLPELMIYKQDWIMRNHSKIQASSSTWVACWFGYWFSGVSLSLCFSWKNTWSIGSCKSRDEASIHGKAQNHCIHFKHLSKELHTHTKLQAYNIYAVCEWNWHVRLVNQRNAIESL